MESKPLSQVEKNPIATPYPVVPGAAPLPWWLTSKTIYGLVTLLIAFGLTKLRGTAVTPEDQAVLEIADTAIAIIGAALTLIGRVHAEAKIRAATKGNEGDQETPDYGTLPAAVPQPLPLVDDARWRDGGPPTAGGFAEPRTITALLVISIFLLIAGFLFSGCSALDQTFRSHVESVEITGGSSGVGGTVRFRVGESKAVVSLQSK